MVEQRDLLARSLVRIELIAIFDPAKIAPIGLDVPREPRTLS
jgi:hypothetical protein